MSAQESKLEPAVKSLMELIFDEKRMTDAIVEMKYDIKKLPLGKLTADQIKGQPPAPALTCAHPAQPDTRRSRTLRSASMFALQPPRLR